MPKETKSLSSAILKVADATKPGTTPLEVLSLISNEIVPWLPGPQAKLVGKIVGFIFQTLAEKEKEKDDLKEIRNSLATIEGKVDKLSNEAVHNFNIAQLNKDLTSATSDLKEAIYTWQHELADTVSIMLLHFHSFHRGSVVTTVLMLTLCSLTRHRCTRTSSKELGSTTRKACKDFLIRCIWNSLRLRARP